MRACRHENVHVYEYAEGDYEGDETRCEKHLCLDCRTWLSLGPSSDSDPRVQLEMRAAELLSNNDHWRRLVHSGIPGQDDEVDGYLMWFNDRVPRRFGHLAGYLAAAILEHFSNTRSAPVASQPTTPAAARRGRSR